MAYIRLFSLVYFLLLFNFVFPNVVRADNLLLNSSFEDSSSGSPNSWTKNVSTATLSTSTTAKTGSLSASINKTNSSTGSIYLYQDVDVEPGSYYSLSGWTVKNSSNFSYVVLRISWRDSGAEISTTDSLRLTADSTEFQQLKIDSVQAPSLAVKARIELLANISTVNPINPVLFDDVNFSQVAAPEQPVSTPSPTPISSPTTTPSPTPVVTATPSPTPKPTPTKSPAPSPTESPEPEITEIVLGAEESPTPTPNPDDKTTVVEGWVTLGKILPFVFIIGGVGILAGVVFTFVRQAKLQYNGSHGNKDKELRGDAESGQ